MRITAEPGWKWSNDVKPHVGTESCQTKHLGFIAQGTVCVKMDDGTEAKYSAGQAYSIDPGHDGCVVCGRNDWISWSVGGNMKGIYSRTFTIQDDKLMMPWKYVKG